MLNFNAPSNVFYTNVDNYNLDEAKEAWPWKKPFNCESNIAQDGNNAADDDGSFNPCLTN